MSVYTKKGDDGTTRSIDSKRSKGDLQIEAVGNVDELNSFLGWLHDQSELRDDYKKQLFWIQSKLFAIGLILSSNKPPKELKHQIEASHVQRLEEWIDEMEKELPPIHNFIFPVGHQVVSLAHVCRTICRRAERSIVKSFEDFHEKQVLHFINRLSDYLFIFARSLGNQLNIKEIPWS